MNDQSTNFLPTDGNGSASCFRAESFQQRRAEFQELIKTRSERIEEVKAALIVAQTWSDEMTLLRELTEEIVALRDLRERLFVFDCIAQEWEANHEHPVPTDRSRTLLGDSSSARS